jgi:predicted lysophospholipase L1 biosynthesis ABC-type transport system permease subunit
MRWTRTLRLRLRSLLRGGRVEQELTEEFQDHLERTIDEYVASGQSPSAARSHALQDMGAIDQRKEECRDVSGLTTVRGLRQDAIYALRGLAQTPGYITNLVVRTNGDPLAQAAAIRRVIHDVDPTQAVSGVGTLEQDVSKVLAPSRLRAILVTSVAIIAIALAAIGLYGLLAYIVNQRTHEIGIRLALGATRESIFGALFNQGARLVIGGLVLGLGVGIWLRRLVSTFVFGVTAGDPATYAVASAVFLLIAFAAVAVPAMRAARAEPIMALRYE